MALPVHKPDTERNSDADAASGATSRPEQPGPAGDMHAAVNSPARSLQAKLQSELSMPEMPSRSGALTMVLVVALACAIAALGLFGGVGV